MEVDPEFTKWWGSLNCKAWLVEFRILQQYVGTAGDVKARVFMTKEEADEFTSGPRVSKVSMSEVTVVRGRVTPDRWQEAVRESLLDLHQSKQAKVLQKQEQEKMKAAKAKRDLSLR